MTDFSRPHKGVAFFGLFAEESADTYGCRDAMAILAAAIEQTQDRDLRHDSDTLDALAFLQQHGGHQPAARAFQAALAIQHPDARRQVLTAAYKRLCRSVHRGLAIDP